MSSRLITRRRFVRTVAAATSASVLNSASRCRAASRKYKFVDIHTHLGTFYWGRELSPDGLVRLMDKHDIERAVVLPLVSPESSPYPQTTEAALAAQRAHPDRLIAFCAVDPRVTTGNPNRYGHVEGVRGIKEIIQRYKDLGARGFGEHKVGLPFDHPLMMMIYESCSDLDLPILFHLDDIRSFDGPGLPRLENVLKAFPKLPLIGHAAGFWASISGDATNADFGRYPRIPTPVSAGGALDRLMEKFKNLYGDLSEPGGYSAIARDRDFGRAFLIRRADQLLFGTDFLMPDQEIPHFALYESLDLPADVQQKIYRGNALRLLDTKA